MCLYLSVGACNCLDPTVPRFPFVYFGLSVAYVCVPFCFPEFVVVLWWYCVSFPDYRAWVLLFARSFYGVPLLCRALVGFLFVLAALKG